MVEIQTTRDVLRQFYEEVVSKKSSRARRGEVAFGDEGGLVDLEFPLILKNPLFQQGLDKYEVRREILIGMFYDRLQAVHAIDPHLINSIEERVRDPVLDGLFDWLKGKVISTVSKEEFIKKFDPGNYIGTRRLPSYFRPLVLLDLMAGEPELTQDLIESSTYFPHQHFMTKKITLKDIEQECAKTLPGIFSEEMASLVESIEEYLEPRTTTSKFVPFWVGKYRLPHDPRFTWTATDLGLLEEKLDNLLNGWEIHKELYNLLTEYVIITGREIKKSKANPRNIGRRSDLFLTIPEYKRLLQGIRNYARNQILYAWKESEGKAVVNTLMTKFSGLKAELAGEELEIINTKLSSREHCSLESRFFNTTEYLPYFVAILNRAYKFSLELQAQDALR